MRGKKSKVNARRTSIPADGSGSGEAVASRDGEMRAHELTPVSSELLMRTHQPFIRRAHELGASVGGVRVDDGFDELRPLWRLLDSLMRSPLDSFVEQLRPLRRLDVEREPLGAHHLLERPPPLGRHLEHPACGDVSRTCRGRVVVRRARHVEVWQPSSFVASSDTCGGSEGRPCRIFLYSSVVESASKGSR